MRCEELEMYIVDYVEESLDDKKRKEVDEHLQVCVRCRNEVKEFRRFPKLIELNEIKINEKFMDNIEEKIKSRSIKRRRRRGSFKTILIAAAILCISIITVIAYQNDILGLIRKEATIDETIDKGFGERVNISKTDKNIKVTLTSVSADDTQMLVFYRIENLKNDKRYVPKIGDISTDRTLENKDSSISYLILCSEGNKTEGRLKLDTISENNKLVYLGFNKLESDDNQDKEIIEGNWNFQIPVKKYGAKIYNINRQVIIGEMPVVFTQMLVAPTRTILKYKIKNTNSEERVEYLDDVELILNNKQLNSHLFNFGDTNDMEESSLSFSSIYFEKHNDITIKIGRYVRYIKNPKVLNINLNNFSKQEFEYLGSKIVVEELRETKEKINFVINESLEKRQWETIDTGFKGFGFGASAEGIFIDKDNDKYDYIEGLKRWDEIKSNKPVLYITKIKCEIDKTNKHVKDLEKIQMNIEGYTKTEFIDERIKVALE